MPTCYLCDRIRHEGADLFPLGLDKVTGRPQFGCVYPRTLMYFRHTCDAPTQGERANIRREAAAELQALLLRLHAAAAMDGEAAALFDRALVLVEKIRTNG